MGGMAQAKVRNSCTSFWNLSEYASLLCDEFVHHSRSFQYAKEYHCLRFDHCLRRGKHHCASFRHWGALSDSSVACGQGMFVVPLLASFSFRRESSSSEEVCWSNWRNRLLPQRECECYWTGFTARTFRRFSVCLMLCNTAISLQGINHVDLVELMYIAKVYDQDKLMQFCRWFMFLKLDVSNWFYIVKNVCSSEISLYCVANN